MALSLQKSFRIALSLVVTPRTIIRPISEKTHETGFLYVKLTVADERSFFLSLFDKS